MDKKWVDQTLAVEKVGWLSFALHAESSSETGAETAAKTHSIITIFSQNLFF